MHQHIAHKPRSGTHCDPGQHSQTPTLSGLKIGPWHAATTSPALDSPGCQIPSLLKVKTSWILCSPVHARRYYLMRGSDFACSCCLLLLSPPKPLKQGGHVPRELQGSGTDVIGL